VDFEKGLAVKGLVTALQTLTALPIPGRGAKKLSSSLSWFAVVGGLLGGVLYLPSLLASHPGFWHEGAAAVVLLASILLTRGLHLDGLADCADGFGGSRDRDKVLAIMKDSQVGAFGAMALIAVLLVKWVALSRLFACGLGVWIIAAYVTSRAIQAELAVCLPYARSEGGTGAPFVEDARGIHRAWALLTALLLLLIACGPTGAAALMLGWVIGRLFGLLCRRRVGGITGDLLGAASEIVETAILLAAAFGGRGLAPYSDWNAFL
jgi:adenosylcobinamide-GDP ribazoletransferase